MDTRVSRPMCLQKRQCQHFATQATGLQRFGGQPQARRSKNVCAEVVARRLIGCAVICRLAPLHREGSPSLGSDVEQMSIRLPAGPAGSRGEPTIFIATCEQPDRGVKMHARPAPQDTGRCPSLGLSEVGSPQRSARPAASRGGPSILSVAPLHRGASRS